MAKPIRQHRIEKEVENPYISILYSLNYRYLVQTEPPLYEVERGLGVSLFTFFLFLPL